MSCSTKGAPSVQNEGADPKFFFRHPKHPRKANKMLHSNEISKMARVGTVLLKNHNVFLDPKTQSLRGICIDIWEKVSNDLNITYSWTIARNWIETRELFNNGSIDVIVQTVEPASASLMSAK